MPVPIQSRGPDGLAERDAGVVGAHQEYRVPRRERWRTSHAAVV